MKILQVTGSLTYPLGGAEQYVIALCEALSGRGLEVSLLVSEIDKDVETQLEEFGVRVLRSRSRRPYKLGSKKPSTLLGLLFHLMDLLESFSRRSNYRGLDQFSIVHIHRFQGLGLPSPKLRSSGIVLTAHDHALIDTRTIGFRRSKRGEITKPMGFQRLRALIIAKLLRGNGALVLFPGPRVEQRHLDLWRSRAPMHRLLALGWKVNSINETPKTSQTEKAASQVKFLYLGALNKDKGVDLLLQAAERKLPQAQILVAGVGEMENAMRESSNIDFLGWVDGQTKAKLLQLADCVLVPSRMEEVFSLVSAEAILSESAVICTKENRAPFLEHGTNALVVEPDVEGFAEAINKLTRDSRLLKKLQSGAKKAAETLSFEVHTAQLIRTYHSVLKE
jgi:glycosyltransferase involved in cell wall biosynthesis